MKYFSLFLLGFLSLNSVYSFAQQNVGCQASKQAYWMKTREVPQTQANNLRSDTIDVLKYTINLDFTPYTESLVDSTFGNCEVRFTPKMNNINTLSLDLLELHIDSIKEGNTPLSYSYNDTLIVINLPLTMNTGDTSSVVVYYNGVPQGDASGWGGFYFQNSYAFNLGVGFAADPHNYGRVWYPCFDNFVERAEYEFNITSSNGKVASCNGALTNEVIIAGDTVMRTWKLTKQIPSYLACVAVTNYETVNQIHTGIAGPIPIELHARATDTTNMKNSFVNLTEAIDAFENAYGQYRWNKVGYSVVPFSSGAMEHATNIAYPKAAVNGNTSNQDLMAHELAHMWWGDLATCETAEEMWLNEGMAVFSEHIFNEHLYGRQAYMDLVLPNHTFVLRYPHNVEGGYLALDNVPHAHTYGDHVYEKGADVAHSMRGFLGDSLFFSGLTDFLANHQFTSMTSVELRDHLTTFTGTDMTQFFEGWVLNGGWPHFYIDSFEVAGTGPYTVTTYMHQKLVALPNFLNDIPLEITFMDNNWNEYMDTIVINGEFSSYNLTLPFNPTYATLNKNNLIGYAVSDDQVVVNSTGTYNMLNGLFTLYVDALQDSAYIRVEHNWAQPDPFKDLTKKYQLSPNRWWRIDGILPIPGGGIDMRGRIVYDGRMIGPTAGWLDTLLVGQTEDSLHLFYRKNPGEDWSEYPYYTKDILGNPTNAFGLIEIDSLLLGEYVLANDKYDVSINEPIETPYGTALFPNPNNGSMTLNWQLPEEGGKLEIINLSGKQVASRQLATNRGSLNLHLPHLQAGIYFYTVTGSEKRFSGKLVIVR